MNIKEETSPDVLFTFIENFNDPTEILNILTKEQLDIVKKYQETLRDKITQEVEDEVKKRLEETKPSKTVTPLMKVRLIDKNGTSAILNVWRPSEEVNIFFKENIFLDVISTTATGMRNKILQLSTSRRTQYVKSKIEFVDITNYKRTFTPISEIDKANFTPKFNEFDTIGFVIHIKTTQNGVILVYLVDTESHFLSITFWTSLQVFGCEDIVKEGSLLCLSNLQWRHGRVSWKIPGSFATDLSGVSIHPRQAHFQPHFNTLKKKFTDKELKNYISDQKEKLISLLNQKELSCGPPASSNLNSPSVSTPSTPVEKRMRLLSSYGQPSPLSPLPTSFVSHRLNKEFCSPVTTPRFKYPQS